MTKNIYDIEYTLGYQIAADSWDDAVDKGREALCITLESLGVENPEEYIYVFNKHSVSKGDEISEEDVRAFGSEVLDRPI